MKYPVPIGLFVLLLGVPCFAGPPQKAPSELISLLTPDEKLVTFVRSDLNGDRRYDFLFVVAIPSQGKDSDCIDENRTLKIALRQSNGSLKIVQINPHAILCSEAGGIFGDSFLGLEAKQNKFVISHSGGGNCRWATHFTFSYSTKESDWYLSRAYRVQTFWCEPENPRAPEERTFRYPRDFKKIVFRDFDPEIIHTW